MLDLQFICDHRDEVVENCRKRGVQADVDAVLRLRQERNELIARGDELRRQQKDVSAQIPKASASDRPGLVEQGRVLRDQVATADEQLRGVELRLRDEQARIPNMTHPNAPVGGEADEREHRGVGPKPVFSFRPEVPGETSAPPDLYYFPARARRASSYTLQAHDTDRRADL